MARHHSDTILSSPRQGGVGGGVGAIRPPRTSTIVPINPNTTTRTRNIEKVIFGDMLFETWYPSSYPKELFQEGGSLSAEEEE
ncbi:MAG: 18S rRNA pseudouridine methyltransferase, partial [Watsoniomyces obsoletus]